MLEVDYRRVAIVGCSHVVNQQRHQLDQEQHRLLKAVICFTRKQQEPDKSLYFLA